MQPCTGTLSIINVFLSLIWANEPRMPKIGIRMLILDCVRYCISWILYYDVLGNLRGKDKSFGYFRGKNQIGILHSFRLTDWQREGMKELTKSDMLGLNRWNRNWTLITTKDNVFVHTFLCIWKLLRISVSVSWSYKRSTFTFSECLL